MKLKELKTIEETKGLKRLGTGGGVDLGHCIYEGILHCEDFEKRAKYYHVKWGVIDTTNKQKFITNQSSMVVVEFFE